MLAALVGALLIACAITPLGIGISQDSVHYFAAATSLLEQGKMLSVSGGVFIRWAPLFPLQIALLDKLPFNITATLSVLNVLIFIVMIFISWRIITQCIESDFFRAVAVASIAFSFTIIQVYCTAWSEPLFILLINLFIVLLAKCRENAGVGSIFALAMVCAMAILQRYPGVFLLPVMLLCSPRMKKNVVVTLLVIAIIPIAAWLARNYFIIGSLTGFRGSGEELFLRNMWVAADTLSSWLLPIKIPQGLRCLIVAVVIFFLLKQSYRKNSMTGILFTTTVSYMAVIIIAYYLTSIEEPRDRILAPVFIPLIILLFTGIEKISLYLEKRNKLFQRACLVIVTLWTLYPAARIIKNVHQWRSTGVDIYNQPSWKVSGIIEWLKQHELEEKIYSNDPTAVYYFTGKKALFVPKKRYHVGFERFSRTVNPDEENYLVWFENQDWYDYGLYDLDELRRNLKFTEEIKLSDGTIYRFHK